MLPIEIYLSLICVALIILVVFLLKKKEPTMMTDTSKCLDGTVQCPIWCKKDAEPNPPPLNLNGTKIYMDAVRSTIKPKPINEGNTISQVKGEPKVKKNIKGKPPAPKKK